MHTKKGPWTVTETKTVYKNPWITVTEDAVIQPDGKQSIFGVVHMKHGVGVLPMDTAGNVYLTQEYHYAAEQETIEVVSGGIDGKETPEAAAKRELKEELGIEAHTLISLGKILPLTSAVNITNYLFLAKNLEFSEAEPEGTEVIKTVKVSFSKAVQMVMDGRISDATSVALILKAKAYLWIHKPWFRASRRGLAWNWPLTWQGWIVFLSYVGIMLYLFYGTHRIPTSPRDHLFLLDAKFMIPTTILLTICYLTGEKPYWLRGKKEK